MKLTIALLLLFLSELTFASVHKFDLKIDFSLNGKHISSPQILLLEGEPSTITTNTEAGKIFLTVTTMALREFKGADTKSLKNKKLIPLQFAVGKIDKAGNEKILSQPQLIAIEGQRATITEGTDKNKEEISIAVTATPAK